MTEDINELLRQLNELKKKLEDELKKQQITGSSGMSAEIDVKRFNADNDCTYHVHVDGKGEEVIINKNKEDK